MKKSLSLLNIIVAACLVAEGNISWGASGSKPPALQPNHTDEMADRMGLTALEYGPFEKDEDDRFLTNLRNAHKVQILAPNASHLTDVFKDQFTEFLRKPFSSMEVILATSDSDFYREETDMTLGFKPGEERYENNRRLVALSSQRLESYAGDAKDHLHIRYFNTQYRLPVTIIDDKYCYMTIRLSPNEPAQSLRLEFTQGADPAKGYYNACRLHFERLWNLSRDSPEPNSNWLGGQVFASWSRTELIAFVACLGTFLGGLGGLLGSPIVKRLMRLDGQAEPIVFSAKVDTASVLAGMRERSLRKSEPDSQSSRSGEVGEPLSDTPEAGYTQSAPYPASEGK